MTSYDVIPVSANQVAIMNSRDVIPVSTHRVARISSHSNHLNQIHSIHTNSNYITLFTFLKVIIRGWFYSIHSTISLDTFLKCGAETYSLCRLRPNAPGVWGITYDAYIYSIRHSNGIVLTY